MKGSETFPMFERKILGRKDGLAACRMVKRHYEGKELSMFPVAPEGQRVVGLSSLYKFCNNCSHLKIQSWAWQGSLGWLPVFGERLHGHRGMGG